MNGDFWCGKRVLITGHTGFKGSWLSIWLQQLGADVTGFALSAPTKPSLFECAQVAAGMRSIIGDIRDFQAVLAAVRSSRPEIVIHMAAQPLVRYSYENPIETYSTNVMGTVHLLEAIRQVNGHKSQDAFAGSAFTKAIVNVTTDKCYENKEWHWGYREDDPMGGYDPYSNSKACSELVTSAYRQSYFAQTGIALASARAGNVIGGGDWAKDRLIPDMLAAFEQAKPVVIRNPMATRPWQHVLEPLSGYLCLAERLYSEGQSYAQAWNFGPNADDVRPVQWIVENLIARWNERSNAASWELDTSSHPHEAGYLKLDIAKAKHQLKWQPRWDLIIALEKIIEWHTSWLAHNNAKQLCLNQIDAFSTYQSLL